MKIFIQFILFGLVVLLYQNCGSFETPDDVFASSTADEPFEGEPASDDEFDAPPPAVDPNPMDSSPIGAEPIVPPSQTPASQTLFVVGVGTGGVRVSSDDGFQSVLSKDYDVAQSLTNTTAPNCNDSAAQIINNKCCYNSSAFDCYGPSGHSDFLYRAVAYGNGRFVAVGGWLHGIVRTTDDGETWTQKQDLHSSQNLVLGGLRNSAGWLSAVAFGKNKFVAVSGAGFLYYSPDGMSWTSLSSDGNGGASLQGSFRQLAATQNGFVATGDSGSWAFSSDGVDWDEVGFAATGGDRINGRIHSLAVNGSIVLGFLNPQGGQTRVFQFNTQSPQAGWSELSSLSGTFNNLTYSSSQSRYEAFVKNKIFYSSNNGLSWSSQNSNLNLNPRTLIYANGLYVTYGASKFYSSTDGVSWSTLPDNSPVESHLSIRAWAIGFIDK